MERTIICFLMAIGLLPLQARAQTRAPSEPAELARSYGFSAAELQKIEDGQILSKGLKEGSDKELAGVVALVVPGTVDGFVETLLQGKMQQTDPSVRRFHAWKPGEPADGSFADLGLDAKDREEIERFSRASAGETLNLSGEEIDRFRKLAVERDPKDPETRRAIDAELRAMLKARYTSYRQSGLKGIAPYARAGNATASPGEELALAIKETIPEKRSPGYARALLAYPGELVKGVEHRFYAYEQEIEGRPAFILSHRSSLRGDGAAWIVEERYYVGHTYDCRFIACDCIPVQGKTLVFYVSRTFTDQVAGMASAAKHAIGRDRMLSDVADGLKQFRDTLRR